MTAAELAVNLFGVIGETAVGNAIANTFRHMDIAEQVIADGKEQYPDKAYEIDRLFAVMYWPKSLLSTAPESAYRAYLRELVERVVNGGDLDSPTFVELFCIVSEASLNAPIDHRITTWLFSHAPEYVMEAVGLADAIGQFSVPDDALARDGLAETFARMHVKRQDRYEQSMKRHQRIEQRALL